MTLKVEPVKPSELPAALKFIAGGGKDDELVRARFDLLNRLVAQPGRNGRTWWTRSEGLVQAAAMIVQNAGRTGMLLYSPPDSPADGDALCMAVRGVTGCALGEGLLFIQAMLTGLQGPDRGILKAAGYRFLAELVYMTRDLGRALTPMKEPSGTQWLTYGQFGDDLLAQVIADTYIDSLDCPMLSGLRPMADVIASHKAVGAFSPESWWILVRSGKPAGCVLVNDYPGANMSDVVYLGLAPKFRRQGLGPLMLRRASIAAARRGSLSLMLAVDASNTPAVKVYRRESFATNDHRWAFVCT